MTLLLTALAAGASLAAPGEGLSSDDSYEGDVQVSGFGGRLPMRWPLV